MITKKIIGFPALPAIRQNGWPILRMLAVICCLAVVGCSDRSRERAEAQVQRIAEDLDKRTTPTGVYVRVKPGEIKDNDPWGSRSRSRIHRGESPKWCTSGPPVLTANSIRATTSSPRRWQPT